ncbi:hypothetical protein KJ784_03275, partial [Patescibacteria group bacterium]|nr:hypothetical protein [Patescibacteria group bacterium]
KIILLDTWLAGNYDDYSFDRIGDLEIRKFAPSFLKEGWEGFKSTLVSTAMAGQASTGQALTLL